MTAIVSSKFRLLNTKNFFDDITDGTINIYMGIGKALPWDDNDNVPIAPEDQQTQYAQDYLNMYGMKKIEPQDMMNVVPRIDWQSGYDFTPWDSASETIYDEDFYCLVNERRVYKLIDKISGSTSVSPPTHITVDPEDSGDGHIWKYMYTISDDEANAFLTSSYMPVMTETTDSPYDSPRVIYRSRSAGTSGMNDSPEGDYEWPLGIEKVVVTSGGSGYTSDPNVEIVGDGTGATATASRILNGTAVDTITITDRGEGYTYAKVIVDDPASGTNIAEAYAVLSPEIGHGTNPVDELGGFYLGFNIELVNDEDGDLPVDNDFRQIIIVKDPTLQADSPATGAVYMPLKGLLFNTPEDAGEYIIDEVITGGNSLAVGNVVTTDEVAGIVYYTQTDDTGYEDFQNGETVTGADSLSSNVLDGSSALVATPIKTNSGDILFIDNKTPITRSSSQTENIKVVIEF